MTFANQVAVITGASSGIGWALAKELSAQGCKIGLIARRLDNLQMLAEEIRSAGGTVAVAAADVGERNQIVPAIRELAVRLGPVDLLIANAGVGYPTILEPLNVEQVEQMVRVNLLGIVRHRGGLAGDAPAAQAIWRRCRVWLRTGFAWRIRILCHQSGRQHLHGRAASTSATAASP